MEITYKLMYLCIGIFSGFILGMVAVKTKKEEMGIIGLTFYFLFIIGFLVGLNYVS